MGVHKNDYRNKFDNKQRNDSTRQGEKRHRIDSSSTMSQSQSLSHSYFNINTNDELENPNTVLDRLSHGNESVRKAFEIILNKDSFKSIISESLLSKVTELERIVQEMKDRMEDLEYSRRNCLKFSGIPETKDENCDQIILNAVNKLILVDEKKKINLDQIGRSHRVGRSPKENQDSKGPRDIIVCFMSYKDTTFANKHNLKTFNQNDNGYRIFVNEALNERRTDFLIAGRTCVKSKKH